MKTEAYDKNGNQICVGDIVERLYKYEIRLKDNVPYAHILDGSKYHLPIKQIGRDFTIKTSDQ